MSVHVIQRLQCLEHNIPNLYMFQPSLLCQLKHILLHILKHKVQNIIILYHFVQLDDIGVVELFENFNLIEADAILPVGVLLLDFLYRYDLLGLLIYCLDD